MAELASLYLLVANYLTGLLSSSSLRDQDAGIGIGPWFAALLAANALFVAAMLALGLRTHAPKLLRACVRGCSCGRSCCERVGSGRRYRSQAARLNDADDESSAQFVGLSERD